MTNAQINAQTNAQTNAQKVSSSDMPGMRVLLNGKLVLVAENTTLSELLACEKINPKTCATAVNGNFIAKDARDQKVLSADDQVMTFEPITGG